MLKRSVLVLAALAWAAPLTAGVLSQTHSAGVKAKCPKAHAQAQDERMKAAQPKGGMVRARTVAPRLSVPEEGSIFAIGRGSMLAP